MGDFYEREEVIHEVVEAERSFYAGTEMESARFFRKDLAEKVGGFDEDIIAFKE